jgi:hypothetical protein
MMKATPSESNTVSKSFMGLQKYDFFYAMEAARKGCVSP